MRRWRRRPRGDAGMSLAELLVTMLLVSLLGLMVSGFFVTVSRAYTKDQAATSNIAQAQQAMNELSRVIRAGTTIQTTGSGSSPVFLSATPESVVLRSYLDTGSANPAPLVARFELSAERALVEKRWYANVTSGPYWTFANLPAAPYSAASSFWTNPASTRSIARSIAPTPGGADTLFVYLDKNLTVLAPTAGALTSSQLANIAYVKITVRVQTSTGTSAQTVTLLNTVGIPNLGTSRDVT